MRTGIISRTFNQALFPAIMTVISLFGFILFYGIELLTTIEPHYGRGLIYAVPFVCFALVTYLTQAGRLKTGPSLIVTGVLIGGLSFLMLIAFAWLMFDTAMQVTTDIKKYERALALCSFSADMLADVFPEEIPADAQGVRFSYNPAFLQGGENLALQFKTGPDTIARYTQKFSAAAEWSGREYDPEAEAHGVSIGTTDFFDGRTFLGVMMTPFMSSRAELMHPTTGTTANAVWPPSMKKIMSFCFWPAGGRRGMKDTD